MKHLIYITLVILSAGSGIAETTIHPANRYAYGANIGWINWQGDITNGAGIGSLYCTGFVYSANVGWIHLGNGPTNGFAYSNAGADDYGLNFVDGSQLRGFAYGANIGWISFATNGNPQLDIESGILSGFAYGANVGWISLSNAQAFVQTTELDSGPDTDTDGIPDAWERQHADDLDTLNGGTNDLDGDGMTDADEYGADTDPTEETEFLHMTAISDSNAPPASILTWMTTKPTRLYSVQYTSGLSNGHAWVDSGIGTFTADPGGATTRAVEDDSATNRVYRALATIPLTP